MQNDAFVSAVGQYDWSVLVKHQLLYNFVAATLLGMGTERHFGYLERIAKNEVQRRVINDLFIIYNDIHLYLDWRMLLPDGNQSWN